MKTTVYGLFVGINAYNRSIIIDNMARFPPLGGCVNDVEAISQQLKSDPTLDCKFELLTDTNATKAAIVAQIDSHLGQAGPNDAVLFYFSGHGTVEDADTEVWTAEQDKRLEGIVCYYTENKSGKFLLADKELRYLFAKLSEKTKAHIVTIFDCCHSGDNTRGQELVADQTDRATIRKVDIVFPKRAWGDFVFSKNLQPSDFAGKSIDEVLPHGRYIQMSACESNEPALEVNGHGVLTDHLLKALRQTKGNLTYRDLSSRIRNQVRYVFSQRPKLYTPENAADLESQGFLKKETAVTSNDATLIFNTANEFRIDKGRAHHVEPGQTTVTVTGKNGQPVVGSVKSAFLDAAVVDFGADRANVGTDPQTVRLDKLTQRLVRVHMDCRDRPNKGLKDMLEALTQPANAAFFALEDDPTKADCRLVKHRNHYYLAAAGDGDRPLTMPLRATTPDLAKILTNYLRHVSLWKYALEMRNTGPSNVLTSDALKIEFFDAATDTPLFVENGAVRPMLTERQLADRPGTVWRGGIKVKLTNNTNGDLYVAACYGSYDFSFNTRVLLDPAVPMLEPKAEMNNTKWLFDHRNNAAIPLKLDDSIRIFNWPESTETIKFIFSTEQFELSGLELGALPGPIAQKRSIDADGEEASVVPMRGWNTTSVQLKVKNPLANTVDEVELQGIIGAAPNPNNSIMAQLLLNLYFDAVGTGSSKKWKLKSGINRRDSVAGAIDLEAAAAAWEAYWAAEGEE